MLTHNKWKRHFPSEYWFLNLILYVKPWSFKVSSSISFMFCLHLQMHTFRLSGTKHQIVNRPKPEKIQKYLILQNFRKPLRNSSYSLLVGFDVARKNDKISTYYIQKSS